MFCHQCSTPFITTFAMSTNMKTLPSHLPGRSPLGEVMASSSATYVLCVLNPVPHGINQRENPVEGRRQGLAIVLLCSTLCARFSTRGGGSLRNIFPPKTDDALPVCKIFQSHCGNPAKLPVFETITGT